MFTEGKIKTFFANGGYDGGFIFQTSRETYYLNYWIASRTS